MSAWKCRKLDSMGEGQDEAVPRTHMCPDHGKWRGHFPSNWVSKKYPLKWRNCFYSCKTQSPFPRGKGTYTGTHITSAWNTSWWSLKSFCVVYKEQNFGWRPKQRDASLDWKFWLRLDQSDYGHKNKLRCPPQVFSGAEDDYAHGVNIDEKHIMKLRVIYQLLTWYSPRGLVN